MGELETEMLLELILLLILITPPIANKLIIKPKIPQISAIIVKVFFIWDLLNYTNVIICMGENKYQGL